MMRVKKEIRMIQRILKVRFFSVFSSMAFTLLFSLSAWSSNLVIELTQVVEKPVPTAVVPFHWSGARAFIEDVASVIAADL